ncbi:MAG TPA: acetyl-CoA C-acetyltransferase [Caldithrix abyssi]|uniref:Acetyl-CoA C-acetyltransferase n=1 Tax=Caldithrix abyssi TaxID=187145 RepID=A0A7V5H4B9_CALAY|nr:acetyl-CoA C-acetyltransferase [Caldithrix abyssi]
MSRLKEVVIVSAARTAVGSFGGVFKDLPATKLGSIVIKAALEKAKVPFDQVNEVIMGNVLTANEGQAPARQAALGAGLSTAVQCMTINKVCGSGLKAVMLAAQAIMVGDADVIVAGGMENMSQVPFYVPKARYGYRMGHGQLIDGMIKDGLWDVYNDFHMGNAAEITAKNYNITRQEQDEFAVMSYKRALKAQEDGLFKEEIVPVEIPQRKGEPIVVDMDEEPGRVKFEKIPNLKPAFKQDGTITAANASKINDGAAAVVVMSLEKAKELNLQPMARIISQASFAKKPEDFPTAPADSITVALKKTGLTVDDIDLFEINEAFAVVAIVNNRLLKLPVEKVNVNGGAVAIGHPIGASGARILTTLLYAMKQRNAKRGVASLCIGGGEAATLVIESM